MLRSRFLPILEYKAAILYFYSTEHLSIGILLYMEMGTARAKSALVNRPKAPQADAFNVDLESARQTRRVPRTQHRESVC